MVRDYVGGIIGLGSSSDNHYVIVMYYSISTCTCFFFSYHIIFFVLPQLFEWWNIIWPTASFCFSNSLNKNTESFKKPITGHGHRCVKTTSCDFDKKYSAFIGYFSRFFEMSWMKWLFHLNYNFWHWDTESHCNVKITIVGRWFIEILWLNKPFIILRNILILISRYFEWYSSMIFKILIYCAVRLAIFYSFLLSDFMGSWRDEGYIHIHASSLIIIVHCIIVHNRLHVK